MKRFKRTTALIFLLLFAGISLPGIGALAATDSSMSFDFVLTSKGEETLTAELGDILDIQLELKRIDAGRSGTYTMHSMQAELIFDSRHFALVGGSREVAPAFDATLNYLADGYRQRFIVSRVVMNPNGVQVEDELLLLKFQLEALAEVRDESIACVNYKVNTWSGDRYLSIANDLIITIKGPGPVLYTVNFEKGDEKAWGAAPYVGAKAQGESFHLPDNTFHRDGFYFEGWHDGQKLYAAGDPYTMPDKAVTFTARWTATPPLTTPAPTPKPTSSATTDSQPISSASSGETMETVTNRTAPATGATDSPTSIPEEDAGSFELIVDPVDVAQRKVKIEKTGQGIRLQADDLTDFTFHIQKGGEKVRVDLDTSREEVLIKEKPDGSFDILIDKDGDGVFDTPVAQASSASKFPIGWLAALVLMLLIAGFLFVLYRRRKEPR